MLYALSAYSINAFFSNVTVPILLIKSSTFFAFSSSVSTILWSTSVEHTPDEVSFYIIDCGAFKKFRTDLKALARIAENKVLCLMSESRYASKTGYTSPQHRINKVISEVLYKYDKRILFNVFEGQLYRIQEIFNEIMHTERKVIIMGKRLESIINDAIDKNYIKFDKTRFSSIHNAKEENVVILISDEREKPFSNLDRIIKRYDKFITLNETILSNKYKTTKKIDKYSLIL